MLVCRSISKDINVKQQKRKRFILVSLTRCCVLLVSGQFPPRKIAPRLGLGFDLGLVLELGSGEGGGNFPRGQLS